jgi:hypothetical protein
VSPEARGIKGAMAVWTTKDGRQIPIEDMSDTHLLRTIRLLECRLVDLGLMVAVTALDKHHRKSNIKDTSNSLKALKEEADHRQLGAWGKFGIVLVKNVLED